MCCKSIRLRIIPFVLSLLFGLSAASFFPKQNSINENQETLKSQQKIIYLNEGTGFASGCKGKAFDSPSSDKSEIFRSNSKPVQIISKPRAKYTDEARLNEVQGTVTLRVAFTATGQIGNISVIKGLPSGLTEQSIAAAREIKFEPAKKNGLSVTVTKQVQYSFIIY